MRILLAAITGLVISAVGQAAGWPTPAIFALAFVAGAAIGLA